MNFRIENLGMLFGLFALAVPIILHLLQRRRFDTLDWGAMQFLPDSAATQRKRWLDEVLLMLMRMAMIALIVIALATPVSTSAWLAPLGDRTSRDIVVILDGSFSMDARIPGQSTPWTEAVRWTRTHVEQATGERFTFVIARRPTKFVNDLDELDNSPRANPDVPRALAEAWTHLQRSQAANKEIVILTDGQKHGWADVATLAALDNLGSQWRTDAQAAKDAGAAIPSLRVVKVGGELPKTLPNYRLAPLTTSRGVAKIGQKITFKSMLHLDGFTKFAPPRSVSVAIDGVKIRDFTLPADAGLEAPIPLVFPHRFTKDGSYVVSFQIDADEAGDALPGDNRQQFAELVKEWPILLVDGDDKLSEESSSLFLERALAPEWTVPHTELDPLAIMPEAAGVVRPAMIVLADVPHLEPAQLEAIDRYLAQGGGLLVLAGERAARGQAFYNEHLHRDWQGWLPAKLGEVATSKDGAKPDPRSFQHPALDALRAWPEPSLREVSFKKWWRAVPGADDRATVVGRLTNGDPFLIEKPYKQGRVILCTVPPDRRWSSTLPKVGEFLILVYELSYYLAGNRDATARPPPLPPLRKGGTGGEPADPRESDLTRCTIEDWRKVRDRLPVLWHEEPTQDAAPSESRREELWWLLLLAVVCLLCSEVWLTRRMALARGR